MFPGDLHSSTSTCHARALFYCVPLGILAFLEQIERGEGSAAPPFPDFATGRQARPKWISSGLTGEAQEVPPAKPEFPLKRLDRSRRSDPHVGHDQQLAIHDLREVAVEALANGSHEAVELPNLLLHQHLVSCESSKLVHDFASAIVGHFSERLSTNPIGA